MLKWEDDDLPWLYREKVVIITFVSFYLSVVCFVVNLLILCPCCFLAHFTLCCPTCKIFPLFLTLITCCGLLSLCVVQARPIFDKKYLRKLLAKQAKRGGEKGTGIKAV